jgi:hypothetical protein
MFLRNATLPHFKFGCKGTTKIWNKQGIGHKNEIYLYFYGARPCYSHECAAVASEGTRLRGVPKIQY